MKTQAIIPTAGTGTRLNTDVPKPMVAIHGKPLCAHTLEVFERCPAVDSVIVVGHSEQLAQINEIVKQYGLRKVVKVVAGGATRRASVANGIAALDGDTEVVVVHDGARPLVSRKVIEEAIGLCGTWDAVITAVPVKSTIKIIDPQDQCVERTLNRDELRAVQTPQVFKRAVLEKAHRENTDPNPPDDSVMAERLGVRVRTIAGDPKNSKITTAEDLVVAGHFLKGASC